MLLQKTWRNAPFKLSAGYRQVGYTYDAEGYRVRTTTADGTVTGVYSTASRTSLQPTTTMTTAQGKTRTSGSMAKRHLHHS